MKIALTTSSDINRYASTLIEKLTAESLAPIGVISTEQPPLNAIRTCVRNSRPRPALQRMLARSRRVESGESGLWDHLEAYARANGLSAWDRPLARLCRERGIDFLRVTGINTAAARDFIQRHEIDLLLNTGGGLFRKRIIAALRRGILNAHMGELPRYRGMNVLEWSLLEHGRIGVSLHFIDRGVDTGDILLFQEIVIDEGDRISTLRAKSLVTNVELMVEGIKRLASGDIQPIRQRPEDGKQYFVMHARLRRIAEQRLAAGASRRVRPAPNRGRGAVSVASEIQRGMIASHRG